MLKIENSENPKKLEITKNHRNQKFQKNAIFCKNPKKSKNPKNHRNRNFQKKCFFVKIPKNQKILKKS
jgi:hypothetical protein